LDPIDPFHCSSRHRIMACSSSLTASSKTWKQMNRSDFQKSRSFRQWRSIINKRNQLLQRISSHSEEGVSAENAKWMDGMEQCFNNFGRRLVTRCAEGGHNGLLSSTPCLLFSSFWPVCCRRPLRDNSISLHDARRPCSRGPPLLLTILVSVSLTSVFTSNACQSTNKSTGRGTSASASSRSFERHASPSSGRLREQL
jgi:hypothetical protein